mgnify:FL=1
MQAADILLMKGNSGWASDLVTWVGNSDVSHAVLVICTEPTPIIIESINPRVRTVPLDVAIQDHSPVYLLKNTQLTPAQREYIVRAALKWSTRDYSFHQCAIAAIDELTQSRWASQHQLFPEAPMCSWLVAEAYKENGLDFGEPAAGTGPWDIKKFALAHPQFYEVLRLR